MNDIAPVATRASPVHERLDDIALGLSRLDERGRWSDAITTRDDAVVKLRAIAAELRNAAAPTPPTPTASANIIAAIRAATTDGDLADTWRRTKADRLGLPVVEQALVVMAWIDQATALAMDDGR